MSSRFLTLGIGEQATLSGAPLLNSRPLITQRLRLFCPGGYTFGARYEVGFPGPRAGILAGQRTNGKRELTETSTGIEVGQAMPAFELPDEEGRPFNLLEQLREGPVVLVFYRGDW